jgi:hypothetical protein
MTVDELLLPYWNRARPQTAGSTEPAARRSPPADANPTTDTQDEMPVAFVPPPVSITRVFPGL